MSNHGQKWCGKVLGALRDLANAEGFISGVSLAALGQMTNVRQSSVTDAINLLIDDGELERISSGGGIIPNVYRLTDQTSAPVSSGIEAMTWLVPNRNYLGATDSIPTTAVSLPRVRWLERVSV